MGNSKKKKKLLVVDEFFENTAQQPQSPHGRAANHEQKAADEKKNLDRNRNKGGTNKTVGGRKGTGGGIIRSFWRTTELNLAVCGGSDVAAALAQRRSMRTRGGAIKRTCAGKEM